MERPDSKPSNLAHRMGRWSGLHPWRAILGWVAFVAICFVAGSAVGTNEIDDSQRGTGDSGRAARMLDAAGFNDQPSTELVFVQTRSGPLSDAALTAVAADVQSTLGKLPDVAASAPPSARPTAARR